MKSSFYQFSGELVNSYKADIEERLVMEIRDTVEIGLPDNDTNLIQLLEDARSWIRQAKKVYSIPENWLIRETDES